MRDFAVQKKELFYIEREVRKSNLPFEKGAEDEIRRKEKKSENDNSCVT